MGRRHLVGAAVVAVALFVVGLVIGTRFDSSEPGIRLSDNDIGFAQDMAVHHEQAIFLAGTLDRAVDPQVRLLADQISRAQTTEIATMHGWLALFDENYTSAHPMAWMHSTGEHHSGPMPGMASVDEIERLRGLRGTEAEIYFLQLMIRHHTGGVEMAKTAMDLVDSDPIRRTALGMVREQGNEIGLMTALLTARNGQPLPYP